MKRLIHANKTLKIIYTLKHKVNCIHFMPPHAFLKIYAQTYRIKCLKNVYSLVGLASKNENT